MDEEGECQGGGAGGVAESPNKVDGIRVRACMERLMSWYICYCDMVPMKALYDVRMLKHVFSKLDAPEGPPVERMLGPVLSTLYDSFEKERLKIVSNRKHVEYQVLVNIKSYRLMDGEVGKVAALSMRMDNGVGVVGDIEDLGQHTSVSHWLWKALNDTRDHSVGGSSRFWDSVKHHVRGLVLDAGINRDVHHAVEEAFPSAIVFTCQARAVNMLLKSIINNDMLLQETILESRKIYEYAVQKCLLSPGSKAIMAKRRGALCHAAKPNMCTFALELLEVDKIQGSIKSFAKSSTLEEYADHVIVQPNDAKLTSDAVWIQISMYAKLLEPVVDILCVLEQDEPTLGQIHLIWDFLSRHGQVWHDLVLRTNGLESCTRRCASLHTIQDTIRQYRMMYHHPIFTLGYLLDSRLWKISNSMAKPDTSTLSNADIKRANAIANKILGNGGDAGLGNLVHHGMKVSQDSNLLAISRDVLYGWRIPSDSNAVSIQKMRDVHYEPGFQLLMEIVADTIWTMHATSNRNPRLKSCLKWMIKGRDPLISAEQARMMAMTAVHHAMQTKAQRPLACDAKPPRALDLFAETLGIDNDEAVRALKTVGMGFHDSVSPSLQYAMDAEQGFTTPVKTGKTPVTPLASPPIMHFSGEEETESLANGSPLQHSYKFASFIQSPSVVKPTSFLTCDQAPQVQEDQTVDQAAITGPSTADAKEGTMVVAAASEKETPLPASPGTFSTPRRKQRKMAHPSPTRVI